MNIGISCYPTHGGSGVVATELGIELAKRGHHVHIISYTVPFRLHRFHPNLFFHEVELQSYPLFKHPPFELALINKMADVAKTTKLDIIHAHYAIPHAISAYVTRQMLAPNNPKVITTLHGTDITLVGSDPSFYDIVQFSINQSDGVTTVSQFLKERTVEEFKIKRPVEVINNFVDTERFAPRVSKNREYYAQDNERIICHVSNFRPVKRIKDVVQVFAKIQEEIPSVLLLVGEGKERNIAQEMVLELGLQYRVHFLGSQDYVEDILAISDLFLLTSEKESFGLVALEAMSCGVPVVGSNAEGIPEVVKNGVTGYLYNVGEVDHMAKSAIDILSKQSRFDEFSHNSRDWVLKNFTSDIHVQHYLDYYEKILSL